MPVLLPFCGLYGMGVTIMNNSRSTVYTLEAVWALYKVGHMLFEASDTTASRRWRKKSRSSIPLGPMVFFLFTTGKSWSSWTIARSSHGSPWTKLYTIRQSITEVISRSQNGQGDWQYLLLISIPPWRWRSW